MADKKIHRPTRESEDLDVIDELFSLPVANLESRISELEAEC